MNPQGYVGCMISNFYCNGLFGRRYDLEESEILAVGDRWIVIRTTSGDTLFAELASRLHMETKLTEWVDS